MSDVAGSVPWSPYIGPPWTHALSWKFAIMLGNDRAESHHRKQTIEWDNPAQAWKVSDQ